VRTIINKEYERDKDILTEHDRQLHLMADALMRYETIDARQIDQIMDGHEPDPPEGWDDSGNPPTGSSDDDAPEPAGRPAEQT